IETGRLSPYRTLHHARLLASVIGGVLLCAALLSGCGDDSGVTGSDGSPSPTTPAATVIPPLSPSPVTASSPSAPTVAAPQAKAPVPQHVAPPASSGSKAKPQAPPSACDTKTHYVNSKGSCVPRPAQAASAPAGATAKCKDGAYSFSQSRRGTCSGHGGVAAWL
ncbi:MAG: DUF3761 domain-containing protein, partial [Mycobacteriales bacterium]